MDTSGSGVDAADKLSPDEGTELNGLVERWAELEGDELRRLQTLQRKAEPPSPKLQEKLDRIDAEAAVVRAAFNRGDLDAVRAHLASTAPPPRADIERLERHINASLRPRANARALSPRRPAAPRSARPRGRRAVTRARARAPGREPDGEPEPPLAKRRP